MSYGNVPYWVQKQNESILKASYENETARLNDKIKELEKENSDLKKEITRLENILFVATDLLIKKI